MRIPSLTQRGERNAATDDTPTKPLTPTKQVDERPSRVETRREPVPVPEPRGPRPRTSGLATLALITGVTAALVVLTGVLAGYAIGLGALAVLLAIGGISATGRRHVAGKSAASIGLVLGLAAIVVGILVVTDSLSWLTTGSDEVGELRNWLDAQTVDRF